MIKRISTGFYQQQSDSAQANRQNINLLKINNYKEHFLLRDGLNNISYDLDFSIYKKYRCFANCEICYLKNDWISKTEFALTALTNPPEKEVIDKLLYIFSFFDLVSIIDDLYHLKKNYPGLFKFYQDHQNKFFLSSMTDNSIFRHKKIIDEGFRPLAIHEISISDTFLNSVGFDMLIEAVSGIHQKVPVKKIKHLLFLKANSSDNSKKLIEWCQNQNIVIEKQLEFSDKVASHISTFEEKQIHLPDSRHEESTTYTEDFGDIYPVNNEVLFLMNDGFFTELKSATSKDRNDSFQDIKDFDAVHFLAKVLNEKKRIYDLYCSKIKNGQSDSFKYFQYISKNMTVNSNFNFVPSLILKPYTQYYKRLIELNLMTETPYGLVKPDINEQASVIPIVSFKESL